MTRFSVSGDGAVSSCMASLWIGSPVAGCSVMDMDVMVLVGLKVRAVSLNSAKVTWYL